MSNQKVLECLEQNVDGLEIIQNLMRYDDPLVYGDLMLLGKTPWAASETAQAK